MTREATCSCGAVRLIAEGDPIRVSICHCLACQRRSGGPFGHQARFPRAQVTCHGEPREWTRLADEDGEPRTQAFCGQCGATVWYWCDGEPEVIAVPVGAFADPGFPAPQRSVWEERKHAWVVPPDGAEHIF